ncbi:SDR family NAD(P)-dependent oxidoreductase [Streptomyces sp. NBC_00243]|uniref:SDR family NAD(P)-dependent oxidoreductase n=1 Tax=Streptomyces sp. NBC_00243 TaxID=2975688 RepID=UPI002DDA6CAE|nr:SDR family NAD(P)-dependent oxidoreductase [Streptomyces sp. NBC_00243]WRZ18157.1 SDR family NAD(P)-dependent oxidoreductase [Streptomyces sp. NBC_00243]
MTLRPIPVERLDLSSKKLAVIGGTNGLGRAIAQQALARGAAVTVVGRTFRDAPAAGLTFVPSDLSSMSEATRLGLELPVESFDVVLFTTGIIAAKTREETPEHVERDLAISYLSRLAVLQGLSPRLGSAREDGAPRPRVFVMGSPGAGSIGDADDLNSEKTYKSLVAHANTVAGNEVLVLGAKDRFPDPAFFGLGPYLIKTGIRSNFLGEGSLTHRLAETVIGLFMQSPETYAKRMVPLLFAPELEGRSGLMFGHRAQPILPTPGLDGAYVDRYLSASEALLRRALG